MAQVIGDNFRSHAAGTSEGSSIRKAYRSIQDIVFETIRDEILSGRLKPGDSLNTLSLSKRLDVSRTPIREALNRLISVGLVESYPYRGCFVRKLSVDEIIELYYIRAALSGVCARLATRRVTDEQKAELVRLCEEMENVQSEENHAFMLAKNFEYHNIIISAAHSRQLENLILQYYRQSEQYRALGLELPGRFHEVCREHRQILEAILAVDPEKAEFHSREHQLNTARCIAKSLGINDPI